mgnify:CR=1 FL=1|tara:strand:+ start:69 stop:305 length:237 start_codon:yes stop_codon:yes gene_type:complete
MISYEKREQILKLIKDYRESLSEMSEKELYYEFVHNYDMFDEESDSFHDSTHMKNALMFSYQRKLMELPLDSLMEMNN